MLSRPQHATVVDRGSTFLVVGLMGTLLGALAVVVLFWLNMLGQELHRQSQTLEQMAQAQSVAASPVDAARISAKERALDSILAEVKLGTPPEAIRARYEQALENLEELNRRLKLMTTEKEALAQHAETLKRQANAISGELAELRQKNVEADRALQARLDESESSAQQLRNELELKEKQMREQADGTLARNYNLVLWAAIGGWLAFVLAILGLVALWSRKAPSEPASVALDRSAPVRIATNPAAEQSAPHVIE
jgi:CHASE3 domain sensor protein